MMGHDVEYSVSFTDSQLLAKAREEERTLLTRDFALYEHAIVRGIPTFYVQGKTEGERLAEIAKRFSIKLEIDMTTSRCPKCNTQVKPVPAEDVADRVPKNTMMHYHEFWKCPNCGQIYWQGAHWTKIRKVLDTAKEIVNSKSKV